MTKFIGLFIVKHLPPSYSDRFHGGTADKRYSLKQRNLSWINLLGNYLKTVSDLLSSSINMDLILRVVKTE